VAERPGLRIGFLGGVPPAMGGGGLEIQMRRTAAALGALGHTVVDLATAPAGEEWEVTHAFGAEGDVQHALEHWTRHRTPYVVSPVIVASPGVEEAAVVLGARVPGIATHAGLRRRALQRADALVAITDYERRVIRRLAGRGARVVVVPNGVEEVAPAEASPAGEGHVLLLGGISARKRQRDVVEALAGAGEIVVAGAFTGPEEELEAWEAAVLRSGATWLGEVSDPAVVARLQRDAAVLVHLSRAEVQSLAVIETLAQGTPVVLSDIPSHRELAESHPEWVRLAGNVRDVRGLVEQVRAQPPAGPPPAVPSWADVAGQLEALYRSLLS
jgi:glycosyltransferase involved in cell wall biosynthesis